jgi:threonine synthase
MVTPQTEAPELAKVLGIPKLYFKHEDLHPYGSHKGRSIPMMIDMQTAHGATNFALSSSGNAALAALRHIQKRNKDGDGLSLTIFIGQNMNPDKKKALLSEILDEKIIVKESERPLQALSEHIKNTDAASLRQSNDPSALLGYKSLAFEIAGTPDLSAVFIGTSSGTTAQALADYFIEHEKEVAVHIVQTTSNSPIAQAIAKGEDPEEKSIADAIVDKIAHRKDSLKESIEKTHGTAWIASNADIRKAIELLKEKVGIEVTPNGALGLAGFLKALSKGTIFKGAVVCIITGK